MTLKKIEVISQTEQPANSDMFSEEAPNLESARFVHQNSPKAPSKVEMTAKSSRKLNDFNRVLNLMKQSDAAAAQEMLMTGR